MVNYIYETPCRIKLGESSRSLDSPLGLQESEAPILFRQSALEGGKFVSPKHRPPLPSREDPWYSCLLEAESTRFVE